MASSPAWPLFTKITAKAIGAREPILAIISLTLAIAACQAHADTDPPKHIAGKFDYYILALSWNAGWCAYEGEKKRAPSCASKEEYGFRLHGLWPQYEEGWPQFCASTKRNPSRQKTRSEADLFGSAGAAWHQWNKHGRCTGLEAAEYYALARKEFVAFNQPPHLLELTEAERQDTAQIEAAIIDANPQFAPNTISVICRDGYFTEIRICLGRDLAPTPCLGRAARDCPSASKILPPK